MDRIIHGDRDRFHPPSVGPTPPGLTAVVNHFRLPADPLDSSMAPRPGLFDDGPPTRLTDAEWAAAAQAAERTAFPAVGSDFLGFRLEDELGRGAFGRVYLARQADLSGRPVALKVAPDIADESRTLARLQHANIVPVYSYHRAGRLAAACMPFYGRATLARVVEVLSDRPTLPSSGRELKSTVNAHPASTAVSRRSGSPVADVPSTDPPPAALPDGWARLDGLSYPAAVLWLGGQLADGLAHAHARGILHRDLKPANVLLTDDGRPMLLDFNLAEDANRQGAEEARIGGTLPYMAPEQMYLFLTHQGGLDGRCDVYALGVVLFELLTGRRPFPSRAGETDAMIRQMLADRAAGPPPVRRFNRGCSPAVEAIVRKCLAYDPAARYQSADQVREDIGRQLAHLPLRHAPNTSARERAGKWVRRHPRLAVAAGVAAAVVAVGLTAGGAAAYAREQARADHARAVLADHRTAFAQAQLVYDDRRLSLPRLDEALDTYRRLLDRYEVTADGSDDGWLTADPFTRLAPADRERVRADVGEAFYMMAQTAGLLADASADPATRADRLREAGAWHAAAARHAAGRLPRALLRQQADLAERAGDPAAAELAKAVDRTPPGSARDQVLLGTRFARAGQTVAAARLLKSAVRLDPTDLSGWFVRGTVHLDLGQPEAAAECFSACVSLRPDYATAWLNRGMAYAKLGFHDAAREEFDRAVELDPALTQGYVERAFARDALGDTAGAVDDFGRAVAAGTAGPRVYFLRAHVRRKLGDHAGAAADVRDGLARPCGTDPLNWVARSETRLDGFDAQVAAGGPAAAWATATAALSDVKEALALAPTFGPALQQQAHLLSERFGREADARAALDRLVASHPDSADALVDRGVLLARAGDRAAAVRDAEAALRLDTKAPTLYQAACVYAMSSRRHPDDRREALRLVQAAVRTGYGLDVVDADSDLDPLRDDPAFRAIVRDAKRLHGVPPP